MSYYITILTIKKATKKQPDFMSSCFYLDYFRDFFDFFAFFVVFFVVFRVFFFIGVIRKLFLLLKINFLLFILEF